MKRVKDRLNRYRKHAKEGKLDKKPETIKELKEETYNSLRNPPGTRKNDSTQSDSVQTENATTSELAESLVSAVGPTRDWNKFSQALDEILLRNNCRVIAISIKDIEEGAVVTAFNPHFKKCRCNGCKFAVALAKAQINNTDEQGQTIASLDINKFVEDFDRAHTS